MRNITLNNGGNKPLAPDEALKTTALVYLEEALRKEQYEDCAGLIQSAKGFGAEDEDVSKIIAGYIRGYKKRF